MKLIKQYTKDQQPVHVSCNLCRSVLEVEPADVKTQGSDRDGPYVTFRCCQCNGNVYSHADLFVNWPSSTPPTIAAYHEGPDAREVYELAFNTSERRLLCLYDTSDPQIVKHDVERSKKLLKAILTVLTPEQLSSVKDELGG